MNEKIKKIMVGSGSIICISPTNPSIPQIRIELPYPISQTSDGFFQDWQKTGEDLRQALATFQTQVENGKIQTSS